ncbi:hypothetical protein [Brevundimonas sp. LM2]|uniref:hypothetical protein n=1 Tax=Brevundimonas sp. LM2 TaxID=1938605 RepID=UPI0012371DC4|nr:hypothetical protein [Brevundimonas sp. LM2]
MYDWLAAIGAYILYLVIGGGVLGGSGGVGSYVAARSSRNWLGWAVGLAVGCILCALFFPSLIALHDVTCRPFPNADRCQ